MVHSTLFVRKATTSVVIQKLSALWIWHLCAVRSAHNVIFWSFFYGSAICSCESRFLLCKGLGECISISWSLARADHRLFPTNCGVLMCVLADSRSICISGIYNFSFLAYSTIMSNIICPILRNFTRSCRSSFLLLQNMDMTYDKEYFPLLQ